jgi:hypothetical protein
MSADSSQSKVRQRTDEARAASLAKVENRQAVPKRNVLKADVMVAPLDFIVEISQGQPLGLVLQLCLHSLS